MSSASDMALTVSGLSKKFGALVVTDGVSLDIAPGQLHAIIGPNGAGKTTLINQLSGELSSDAGQIWFGRQEVTHAAVDQRARAGLLRSYQITSVFELFTVLENVTLAALGARQHAFSFWRPMLANQAAVRQATQALEATGLADKAQVLTSELGYGERRQLELAMALSAKPKILLLDEPMAGMSTWEADAVTQLLLRLKGQYTIVLIEHDMQAVFALADRITVLEYGRVLFTGTPYEVKNHAQVRAVYLGDEFAA